MSEIKKKIKLRKFIKFLIDWWSKDDSKEIHYFNGKINKIEWNSWIIESNANWMESLNIPIEYNSSEIVKRLKYGGTHQLLE